MHGVFTHLREVAESQRKELCGDRTQQKDSPNDLKCILKSERELEKYLKCNSSENCNNLSLCFYLGSLLRKTDYLVTFVLSCLKNNVHFEKL